MIALSIIILAAICKAVADTLDDHFSISRFKHLNPKFWDKNVSSEYAKRIFSYKIDGWHLFNSGMIVCFILAAVLHPFDKWHTDWYWEILIAGISFNLAFNLFYNKILR